jgi:hypothetical protein
MSEEWRIKLLKFFNYCLPFCARSGVTFFYKTFAICCKRLSSIIIYYINSAAWILSGFLQKIFCFLTK